MEHAKSSFVATAHRVKGIFSLNRHTTLKNGKFNFFYSRCGCVRVAKSKDEIITEAQQLCGIELNSVDVVFQEGTCVVIKDNFTLSVDHITKVDALIRVFKVSQVEISYK